jgi:hypothetical protein
MRPFDYFSESFDSLNKHRMRALLTMLGIIVGVLTVMLTLVSEPERDWPSKTKLPHSVQTLSPSIQDRHQALGVSLFLCI